jgi:hypothetical protein
MRRITQGLSGGPTRRIAIASGLIVVLVAITVVVILVRFGAAADKYESALGTQPSAFLTSNSRTSEYDILNASRVYDASPTAANGATLVSFGVTLTSELRQLARDAHSSGERAAVSSAATAGPQINATLTALRRASSNQARSALTARLAPQLAALDTRFDAVATADRQTATAAQKAAQNSAHWARIIGILIGALAILMVLVLAVYVIRLVGRGSGGDERAVRRDL